MSWETAFMTILTIATVGPIVLALSFCIWQHSIRPQLIPARRIKAMVDLMLVTFGPCAEHEAFLHHQDACCNDSLFA